MARARRTIRLARRPGKAGRGVYQSASLGVDDWGGIARLYDLEHPACRGAELSFWHQEAKRATDAGGDVLELAAGSGRIAIALARRGHRVTGLELSAGMLERAAARTSRLPAEVAERLVWVQGDMTRFSLPGRSFALVFVAYNSFWLLHTEAAQVACLRAVRRHLAPGGRLILDLFPPNEDDRRDDSGLIQALPLALRGRSVTRVKDYTYDAERGVATADVRYYAGGAPADTPATLLAGFRYGLRLASPESVRRLLQGEGFRVDEELGSYKRDLLEPDSPRAIFLATLRDGAASGDG